MRATRKRRHYSTEEKAAIVRRHLVDKVPVSDLCDEYKCCDEPLSAKTRPTPSAS